ncbi:MAG: cytochrome P450 [Sphingomonadales bacterium]|nr:cytochrome P450 [Sphingomonadales bacterium]
MAITQELANTIVDPKAYQAGDPVDEAFKIIRRDMPFDRAHPESYDKIWVASRHADIMEVEKRADVFHNGARSSTIAPLESEPMVKFLTGGEPNLIRSLVAVDGQEHKDLRSIVFPAVTPQAIKKLENDIRGIAKEFAQSMLEKAPTCDFAEDVAFLYPLRVIMTVLGVPQEDEAYMLKLTQEIFSSADPELNRNKGEVTATEGLEQLTQTIADLEAYFGSVTEKFRANPAGNVNSIIANAQINGEYLNQRQLMGYYIIAATAGHDTTSNTTAGAFWALAERPDVFNQIKAEPGLLNAYVEESIRWVTPVKHFMRTAVADTEFQGRKIEKGDYIMLPYQSGNRDEAVFDNPFEFRLDRPQAGRHVAFGYGPHVCLGQHLARMEMRLLWEELLPHIKSVELNGTPERTRSNFVCGPKHVPVRFELN